jgi:hypothetical protein
MTSENVYLWGILPDDLPDGGMGGLLEVWLDIIEPDGDTYPYVVRREGADENIWGESADRESLRTLFDECTSVKLANPAQRRSATYRDLSVTVTAFGPAKSHPRAPLWYLSSGTRQFRPDRGRDDESIVDRIAELLELAKTAHSRTEAVFTYADVMDEPYDHDVHPTRDRVVARGLEQLYWLNVFDSAFADAIGREKLLALDAYECEELPDGSVSL